MTLETANNNSNASTSMNAIQSSSSFSSSTSPLMVGKTTNITNSTISTNTGTSSTSSSMMMDGVNDFHEFTTESKSILPLTESSSISGEIGEGINIHDRTTAEVISNNISLSSLQTTDTTTIVTVTHNTTPHESSTTTTFESAKDEYDDSTNNCAVDSITIGNSSLLNNIPTTDDTNIPDQEQQQQLPRYVTPKDFELLKVIGMGAFGKVLQVRQRNASTSTSSSSYNNIYAMKVISKRLLHKQKAGLYIENIQAERNILTKLIGHPFIINMHCSFQTADKLFIIMDFLAGGELFWRLGREGIFLEKQASFYLSEIILALDHLHCLGILHRDLKPENILLSADGHICLTDFGLAKDFTSMSTVPVPKQQNDTDESTDNNDDNDVDNTNELRTLTVCGTHEYMSPEMLARQGYGRASDYWSLGCIAYEMLSGVPPFESKLGAKDIFRKIMSEKVKMPTGSTSAACKLLKGLLNRNVQNRLGTAKSTMFEVGGVTGLKQQEFFKSPIKDYWDKLLRKEIDPPILSNPVATPNSKKVPPSVNNNKSKSNNNTTVVDDDDGLLDNFHSDFIKMELPRSVVHMSTSQYYNPHRVMSTTFKGFSFVHDDFKLPERDMTEIQSYWYGPTSDDQLSESDCASSNFGDATNGNQNSNNYENNNTSNNAATISDNKKKTPRNRKKKKDTKVDTCVNVVAASTPNTMRIAEVSSVGGADGIGPNSLNDDNDQEHVQPRVEGNVPISSIVTIPGEESSQTTQLEVKHDQSDVIRNTNAKLALATKPTNNNKKLPLRNVPPPPPPQPIFSPVSQSIKSKAQSTPTPAGVDEWQSATKAKKTITTVGASSNVIPRQSHSTGIVSAQRNLPSIQQRTVVGMSSPSSVSNLNKNKSSNIPSINGRAAAMYTQQNAPINVISNAYSSGSQTYQPITNRTGVDQQQHSWNAQGQQWPSLGGVKTTSTTNLATGTNSLHQLPQQPQNHLQSLQNKARVVGPERTVSSSSDWRMHSMSPMDGPGRKLFTAPSSTTTAATNLPFRNETVGHTVAWPSLGTVNNNKIDTKPVATKTTATTTTSFTNSKQSISSTSGTGTAVTGSSKSVATVNAWGIRK